MAAERGHNFTADGARRIVDAVREVEREPVDLAGKRRPRDHGPYVVRRMIITAIESGGLVSAQQVSEGGTALDGYPVVLVKSSRPHVVNDLIIVGFCGSTGSMSGDLIVRWQEISTGGELFPVNVTSDGGSAGNKTTAASWTYTVTDVRTGAALGTGLTQAWARSVGKMVAATRGTGYMSGATFVLFQVDEVRSTAGCEVVP